MWSRSVSNPVKYLETFQQRRKILERIKVDVVKNVVQVRPVTVGFTETYPLSTQSVTKKLGKRGKGQVIKISRPPSSMQTQSTIISDVERIRASAIVEDPLQLATYPDNKTRTLCDVIYSGMEISETGECLGTRSAKTGEYEWISYSEVIERSKNVGSAFIALGLKASNDTLIGVSTKNRTEFILTMLGCSFYSMVLVPLYDNFGVEAISHIISQGEIKLVVCETVTTAQQCLENIGHHPQLKIIVVMDISEKEMSVLKNPNINVLSFAELEALGAKNIQKPKVPSPNDLFAICYTSGTTGIPKGVMISQANVMSCVASLKIVIGQAVTRGGTLLSYLPCAHVYEMVNVIFCLYCGGRLGFYNGDVTKLLDDMAALKPTFLPLVPKLMNRIYIGTRQKLMAYPFMWQLFKIGMMIKEWNLKRGIISKNTIWDKLMFSKVQNILGGEAELIFTSSAPVSKDVMRFFRCTTGCLVFEAYGQSEVCASTMTLLAEHGSGFVGPPLPCNHLKLVDVPEMGYYSVNDVGEVCIRGLNVFQGYFKDPESTKETIDEDGWHHTGDIGCWMPNGALAIIDRKKNLFKLSQGEYVAPEKTEGIYEQCHLLSQIFADGNSDQDFLVVIAVPNKDPFLKWAKENKFKSEDLEILCQQKDVRKAVLQTLLSIGEKRGLNSLHQAGNLYLHTEKFTIENGLLTPTLKLKRTAARKIFESKIKELYAEGSMKAECKIAL